MAICPNCDAEFSGRYCSNCGQRAVHLRPTLHDLLHEALHEFSHVDNKIVRTARLLLFKPGMLTREFFEGKRARSVSPIRLYLLASLLFFGVVATLPQSKLHVSVTQGDAQLHRAAEKINRDPAILSDALTHAFPKLMFVLMPLFALHVFACYFSAERLYVPHLYFSVHYHAFAFVALAAFEAMTLIPWRYKFVPRLAIIIWVIAYLPVALRRVYGGTRWMTALKTSAIILGYLVFLMIALAAIAYVTMRRLG
jgi:hypothetical protein